MSKNKTKQDLLLRQAGERAPHYSIFTRVLKQLMLPVALISDLVCYITVSHNTFNEGLASYLPIALVGTAALDIPMSMAGELACRQLPQKASRRRWISVPPDRAEETATKAWGEQWPYCSGTINVQLRRRHWFPSSWTTCSKGGRRPPSKSQTKPENPRAMHSRTTSWQKGGVGPKPSKLRQSRNISPPRGGTLPLARNRWGPFPMR